MATRTVRLDEEGERLLAELRERTGLSISNVFKRGLEAFAKTAPTKQKKTPWEIYCELDIGPGSGRTGGAANAKTLVREIIRRKHGR